MKLALIILLVAGVVSLVFTSGCLNTYSSVPNSIGQKNGIQAASNVTKVEIVHFHPTQQCVNCRTLGEYAKETIDTYFQNELASGVLEYREVNFQSQENGQIVQQYGITGSSLWIGIYGTEGFRKKENVNVWYKLGNKEEYMQYMKGVVEKGLAGELS